MTPCAWNDPDHFALSFASRTFFSVHLNNTLVSWLLVQAATQYISRTGRLCTSGRPGSRLIGGEACRCHEIASIVDLMTTIVAMTLGSKDKGLYSQ